jgi:ADP-L-glycero-D-manno-heptose 6-epimerase
MGACSSTTETNAEYLIENNYRFTRILAEWAVFRKIRFLYASSAATYGDGANGFSEDVRLFNLRPLNIYAYSKHLFDLYAERSGLLTKIIGVKPFNVFGPNEYHKGEMASVVFKAFRQISETGKMKLFKSYHKKYADGEQVRDFIYVKDCMNTMWWLLTHKEVTGLFNLGTGRIRSWKDLAKALFAAMGCPPQIEYIDMPETMKAKYQYFTRANMTHLGKTGCPLHFRSLEDAVHDYVTQYLQTEAPCLSSTDPCQN